MPNVLAVVSKKLFEAQARRGKAVLGVGDTWGTSRYASTQAAFSVLRDGGDLFLATVRPPDERLWLVAVLRAPTFDGDGWAAGDNTVPITDITALRGQVTFANGSAITAEKGKLGMSLQTPRVLSEASAALLRAAVGIGDPAAPVSANRPNKKAAKPYHLNRHETKGPLPCLCKKCFLAEQETFDAGELAVVRVSATAKGRILYFWIPKVLAERSKDIERAVSGRLQEKYRRVAS